MSSSGVSIRAAVAGDVPGILPLVQKICDLHAAMDPQRFDFEPGVSERYRRWLGERAADVKSVLLVAEWVERIAVMGGDGHGPKAMTGSVEVPERNTPTRSVGVPGRSEPTRSVGVPESREPARLVGFIVGSVVANIPIYRTTEFGMLHDLWVEPEYRGRGVGRALVIEAVRRFERIGVTQIRGETAAGNEAARRMLHALGFRTSMIEMMRTLGA